MVAASGNDPRVRAEAEQVTCVMHAMCGRFDQARAIGADARQHLAEVGHGLFLANLAQSTGHVEELAGDLDAAEARVRAVQRRTRSAGGKLLSLDRRRAACPAARSAREAHGGRGALELARRHGSPDDTDTIAGAARPRGCSRRRQAKRIAPARPSPMRFSASKATRCPTPSVRPTSTAADVEQILGNTAREPKHLVAAQELFEAKGNVVRAREVTSRLRDLAVRG